MTDSELFQFMDSFRGLVRVFPLRGDEHELGQVGASYFRAMRRYPLPQVQAGAEAWIQKGERFPKPAQWIESIPKRPVIAELRALSSDETREYLRAETLRYDDAPCRCSSCQRADVSDKPLRFVPDFDRNDVPVHALIGERIVTTGHWAHGEELARWYAAKNAFWLRMFELFGAGTPREQRKVQTSFEQRMKEIYQEPPRTDAPVHVTPTQIGQTGR